LLVLTCISRTLVFSSLCLIALCAEANREVLILDPEFAALAYLRPFQTKDLAVNGDSERSQLLAELTLEVRNEAAHGIVADLDASL
jgi:hypothetical protein